MTTIKVRVAVAASPKGDWSAQGNSRNSDSESASFAIDCTPGDYSSADSFTTVFIEAEIELRGPVPTVAGKVVQP